MAKIRRGTANVHNERPQDLRANPNRARGKGAPRRVQTAAARRAPARSARHRGSLVCFVQLAVSALLLWQVWRTGMLPDAAVIILGVVLAFCWLLTLSAQKYCRRGAFMRFVGWVLSAAMVVGCIFTQQGLGALENVSVGGVSGAAAQQIRQEPFLLYISGVDTRGELNDKSRSDVNILAAVDPVNRRVALVNTPRDYYVPLAGHDGEMDKLTHAGLYGVDCSMQTLGDFYGVSVQYYLKMDFQGFIDIINALGGIDVSVDEGFTTVGSPGYYDPVTLTAGQNHLDGASALAFARERHAFQNGDIRRGENQMQVISAVLNKVKSPAVLMGYSQIMASVSDSFVTSLSEDQIRALVKMQLSEGGDWQITSFSVTGTSANSTQCYSAKGSKLYVMQPDEASVAQAKQMLAEVLAGQPAQSEAVQSTAAA